MEKDGGLIDPKMLPLLSLTDRWPWSKADSVSDGDRALFDKKLRADGLALENAPPSVKNDFELVKLAVQNHPLAFRFASKSLRSDENTGRELARIMFEKLETFSGDLAWKDVQEAFAKIPDHPRKDAKFRSELTVAKTRAKARFGGGPVLDSMKK